MERGYAAEIGKEGCFPGAGDARAPAEQGRKFSNELDSAGHPLMKRGLSLQGISMNLHSVGNLQERFILLSNTESVAQPDFMSQLCCFSELYSFGKIT